MARSTRPTRTKSAGIVSLAEVARHWQVSPATAAEILRLRGVQDTGLRKRAQWEDTWALQRCEDAGE